jgi:hypothetical protein
MNRVLHYGYQHFLARDKIRAIFGERIAQSKKIRKAKIRDILKNAMMSIEKNDEMTVNDFMNNTEQLLIQHVAEIQGMSSSPVEMEIMIQGKRKKATSPKAAAAAAAADVAGPYRPPPVAPVAPAAPAAPAPRSDNDSDKGKGKKHKVNPLANQMDFITNLMRQTTEDAFYRRTNLVNNENPRRKAAYEEVYINNFTPSRVMDGYVAAVKKDEAEITRQRIAEEEARRTEALRYMRQGMKDITDMISKSKM